jgi:hypothetical protein
MSKQQDDVTDDILDAVENEVGMGCGAWDCVPPKEIIAAAWKFIPNSMAQIDNTPPPWMRRLWAHLNDEHGLILTQDELFQIVRIVREDDVKRKSENSA